MRGTKFEELEFINSDGRLEVISPRKLTNDEYFEYLIKGGYRKLSPKAEYVNKQTGGYYYLFKLKGADE